MGEDNLSAAKLSQESHDLTLLMLHEILGQMKEINIRFTEETAIVVARLEAVIAGLRKELDETID